MKGNEKVIKAGDLMTEIRDDPYINGRAFARVKQHIDDAPTVDTVEVVRCKDCKHYKPRNQSVHWKQTTPCCNRTAAIKMPPDGFCSYGERREGE